MKNLNIQAFGNTPTHLKSQILKRISELECLTYGYGYHRESSRLEKCLEKEDRGLFCIFSENHELVSYIDVWSTTQDAFRNLKKGLLKEESLSPEDVCSLNQPSGFWYIGSLITDKRAVSKEEALVCFGLVQKTIKNFLIQYEKYPSEMLGVASSVSGQRMLNIWGFKLDESLKEFVLKSRYSKTLTSRTDLDRVKNIKPPAQMAKTTKHIDHFLRSLSDQNRHQALKCLSPQFTKEEGLKKEEYLSTELEVFNRIQSYYGIKNSSDINIAIEQSIACPGAFEVQVKNQKNQLVYEWAYFLDENGFIIGNNSAIQTVSKIQQINGAFNRSIAIESKQPISHIQPRFQILENTLTPITDDTEFFNFNFKLKNENLKSDWMGFRFFFKDGSTENKLIWMRGFDRPGFKPSRINFKGPQKIVIDSVLPWSLNVKTKDKQNKYIKQPRDKFYEFEEEVIWCCLTDAYDHDWIIDDQSTTSELLGAKAPEVARLKAQK